MMQVRHKLKSALRLAKDELAVPRQLLLHLFVHLLVRDAGPSHLVLVVDQDLAHFLIEPILDGELFHHALAHAVDYSDTSFGFDLPAIDQTFHNLIGHVRYKVPYEKHLRVFPLLEYKRFSLLAASIKCKEGTNHANHANHEITRNILRPDWDW